MTTASTKKTDDRPELPAPQRSRPPVEYPGIKRLCRNCQHFDAGGLDKHAQPINNYGGCHNGISGRLQTRADDSCERGFYPCGVRWPLRAGPGGVR